jgi:hypothetical protein
MRIIVSGLVGLYPVGGVAWDYLQYVIGLDALGHDVYYYEDTWTWPFDPVANTRTESPDYSVRYIASFLEEFAPHLADRWHYRHLHDHCYGLSQSAFKEIASSADLYLNVSGSSPIPTDCPPSCLTVFVDTDPGYNQAMIRERFSWSENVDRWCEDIFEHHRFATYAENIHGPNASIPNIGVSWITTRMPVALAAWAHDAPPPPGAPWSTVMTWNGFQGPVEVEGVRYGSKNVEFPLIEPLPGVVDMPFEVALGGAGAPIEHLGTSGWHVVDGPATTRTPQDYQHFITRSRGEISIAKNIYVAMRTGWFSCRSACYLASGRPVITQDTGFSKFLPTGEGLFAFSTTDEAVGAIEAVESDYERHCRAAREIAEEYFDARKVLAQLLDDVFANEQDCARLEAPSTADG